MTDKGFTHVRKNDTFSVTASTFNSMLDAAKAHQNSRNNTTVPPGQGEKIRVLVKNTSGSDLSKYNILGIAGMVFLPTEEGFQQYLTITGYTPTAGTHEGSFVILDEAIPNGEFGRAILWGATICEVDITDASHRFADIKHGDATKLVSGSTGSAQMLYQESGTGTLWAVVRIGNPATAPVEQGVPFEDVTADSDTVTLVPTDGAGVAIPGAASIMVYVADSRAIKPISGRGWVATVPEVAEVPEDPGPPIVPAVPAVPAVIGTILTFVRLRESVGLVGGVLVGESQNDWFPALIVAEGTGGEYTEWTEAEINIAGSYQAKIDSPRTHTSTGKSLWEGNNALGVPVDRVVWVRVDMGDNTQFTFDYYSGDFPQLEGGTVPTNGTAPPTVIPAVDEGWIYKHTRAGVEEIAHADPRNEVVYLENTTNCYTNYAFDARGHCIGWWKWNGTTWESPWGFADPSL